MTSLVLLAVFFGDLHVHTQISSDAVGDPVALFQVARVEEDLDFVAITDHDTTIDAGEWALTQATAAAANVPGQFVAFAGLEWTYGTHLNVYFLNDDEPFCPTCDSEAKFYDFYGPKVADGLASAQINHPNNQGPFHVLDASVLRNIEILNGRHGAFDQEGGPQGAQARLAEGHRLGFVAGSDDHSFDGTGESARRLGDTLTGCHAPALTRGHLIAALRARRCFATDNLRTVVELEVDGTPMGGETEVCAGHLYSIDLRVSGTATPSRVELVQNGFVIASRTDCRSPSCDLEATRVSIGTFANLYGRVIHDPTTGCVHCKTFSSPVRVNSVLDSSCNGAPVPTGRVREIALLVALLGAGAIWLEQRRSLREASIAVLGDRHRQSPRSCHIRNRRGDGHRRRATPPFD